MLGRWRMFRPDLRPSNDGPPGYRAVSIGWLASGHEFQRGKVSDKSLMRLKEAASHRWRQTRGYHFCELCPVPPTGRKEPAITKVDSDQVTRGSAELCI